MRSESDHVPDETDVAPNSIVKTHLVLTVHGIRTYGGWQSALGDLIESHKPTAKAVHYQFGYFSALAFLIPFVRDLVARRFQRTLCRYCNDQRWSRIDIVCHSFGTYVVANALMRLPAHERPKIHTLILAASVLKSNYPIDALLEGCAQRIVNECGTKDSVLVLSQLFSIGTGMAGRSGFVGVQDDDSFQNRYWKFHHSQYFDAQHAFMRERWLPLLCTDTRIPAQPHGSSISASRGLLLFLINNADVVKLVAWITPFVVLALYLNGLRVATANALTLEQRARTDATSARSLAEKRGVAAQRSADSERLAKEDERAARVIADQQRKAAVQALAGEKIARREADEARDIADERRREAERQRNIAIGQQLASQAELFQRQEPKYQEMAALLSIASYDINRTIGAHDVLANAVGSLLRASDTIASPASLREVVQAPDSPLVMNFDGQRLWTYDLTTRRQRFSRTMEKPLEAVALLGGGRAAAVCFKTQELAIESFDNQTPVRLAEPCRAVSAAGKSFATLGEGLSIYDSSGQNRRAIPLTSVLRGASHVLLSADATHAAVWSGTNFGICQTIPADAECESVLTTEVPITTVAFDKIGAFVAVGDRLGRIRVYRASDNRQILYGLCHPGGITSLAFFLSESGRRLLVTGGEDGTARVWSIPSGSRSKPVRPDDGLVIGNHAQPVTDVAFGPSPLIAVASRDGTVELVDMGSLRSTRYAVHDQPVLRLAFIGTEILSLDDGSKLRRWTVDEPGGRIRVSLDGPLRHVHFSADGHTVGASGYFETNKTFFSTNEETQDEFDDEDNEFNRTLALISHSQPWDKRMLVDDDEDTEILDFAFSEDAKLVRVDRESASPQFWDVESQETLDDKDVNESVRRRFSQPPAPSPDGSDNSRLAGDRRFFVDPSQANILVVEDARTHAPIARLPHEADVRAFEMTGDGSYVVTASGRIASVWRITPDSARVISRMSHEDTVNAVAIHAGAGLVAAGTQEGTLWLWPFETAALMKDACSYVSRNLTEQEWDRYIQVSPYRKLCSNRP